MCREEADFSFVDRCRRLQQPSADLLQDRYFWLDVQHSRRRRNAPGLCCERWRGNEYCMAALLARRTDRLPPRTSQSPPGEAFLTPFPALANYRLPRLVHHPRSRSSPQSSSPYPPSLPHQQRLLPPLLDPLPVPLPPCLLTTSATLRPRRCDPRTLPLPPSNFRHQRDPRASPSTR